MIDIIEIRNLCRQGKLKAYVNRGVIYLKDTENDECVIIGEFIKGSLKDLAAGYWSKEGEQNG